MRILSVASILLLCITTVTAATGRDERACNRKRSCSSCMGKELPDTPGQYCLWDDGVEGGWCMSQCGMDGCGVSSCCDTQKNSDTCLSCLKDGCVWTEGECAEECVADGDCWDSGCSHCRSPKKNCNLNCQKSNDSCKACVKNGCAWTAGDCHSACDVADASCFKKSQWSPDADALCEEACIQSASCEECTSAGCAWTAGSCEAECLADASCFKEKNKCPDEFFQANV